jgi:hypothetical protein
VTRRVCPAAERIAAGYMRPHCASSLIALCQKSTAPKRRRTRRSTSKARAAEKAAVRIVRKVYEANGGSRSDGNPLATWARSRLMQPASHTRLKGLAHHFWRLSLSEPHRSRPAPPEVAAAPSGESLSRARSPQLYMPPATGLTLDAAEPRPIEGLILFRSGAGLDAQQATQADTEASRMSRMPMPGSWRRPRRSAEWRRGDIPDPPLKTLHSL